MLLCIISDLCNARFCLELNYLPSANRMKSTLRMKNTRGLFLKIEVRFYIAHRQFSIPGFLNFPGFWALWLQLRALYLAGGPRSSSGGSGLRARCWRCSTTLLTAKTRLISFILFEIFAESRSSKEKKPTRGCAFLPCSPGHHAACSNGKHFAHLKTAST